MNVTARTIAARMLIVSTMTEAMTVFVMLASLAVDLCVEVSINYHTVIVKCSRYVFFSNKKVIITFTTSKFGDAT